MPTRYRVQYSLPALKNNFLLTSIGLKAIVDRFGSMKQFFSNTGNLQAGIEVARNNRANEFSTMGLTEKTAQEVRESIEREM